MFQFPPITMATAMQISQFGDPPTEHGMQSIVMVHRHQLHGAHQETSRSAPSHGDHLRITGIHTRSISGMGVMVFGVRSKSGGVGGIGVPGVNVRLRSGGVIRGSVGVGVTVERNRMRVRARAICMALPF